MMCTILILRINFLILFISHLIIWKWHNRKYEMRQWQSGEEVGLCLKLSHHLSHAPFEQCSWCHTHPPFFILLHYSSLPLLLPPHPLLLFLLLLLLLVPLHTYFPLLLRERVRGDTRLARWIGGGRRSRGFFFPRFDLDLSELMFHFIVFIYFFCSRRNF